MGAGAAESEDELPSLEESGGWSSRDGGPRNDRHSTTELEGGETVAWQYDRGGRPAIVDGTVYLRTGSELHALDAADGSLRWEQDDLGIGRDEPTVAGDAVYVGGDRLRALEADTGDVRWEQEFDGDDPVPSPLVSYGTVYLLFGGSLYAFDADDGSLRWRRDSVDTERRDGEIESHSFYGLQAGLVATSEAIWASLDVHDGLAELDPQTGETRWAERIGTGTRSLAATDEKLLVQSLSEESVFVFDLATREIEDGIGDAFVTSVAGRTAVTQGRYELKRTDLDEETGSEWSLGGPYAHGAPVIAGETVVVAHSHGRPGEDQREGDRILGIDLEDGSEKWTFEFDEDDWNDGADVPFLAVEGDTIYTGRDGGIVAVRSAGDDGGENSEDENDDGESEGETGDGENDEPTKGDEDDESNDGGEEPSGDEGETTDDTEDEKSDDEGPTDDGDGEPSESEEDPTDDGDADDDGADGGEFEGNKDDGETESDKNGGTDGDDSADGDDDVSNGGDDDPADENDDGPAGGDDGDETDAGAGDDGDDDTDTGDDADGGDAGEADETDEADDSDGAPGFTTGAGIVGGALGLEWLRRRASDEETARD